ncbi:MAG: hypothetical protein M3422_19020 [Actinomycetota bacterium]|nr:hypothetical protein [Actinomycetota bacterium]
MSDEPVRNEVQGNVTGPVAQVGAVHGNIYLHSSPSAPASEPLLDLAIRIACSLTDEKTWTLRKIAELLAESDPERAEQIIGLIPDAATRQISLTDLAAAIAESDPERAHRLAQTTVDAPVDPWVWVIAIAAMVVAGRDPGQCDRLVRQVEEQRPADVHIPLARLANARRANDPAGAERLVSLAVRLAMADEDRGPRDAKLWWIAHTIAAADPQRAAAILPQLTHDYWTLLSFWSEKVAEAARVHPRFAIALIDTATPVVLGAAKGERSDDYRLMALAIAAVSVDPHRSGRIAAMISWQENQVRALTEMAKATTDHLQARRWLAAAEKAAGNSHSLLGIVAAAAMNIDPTLSRRARGRIVDAIGSANSARGLVDLAKCLAAVDPVQALQLVGRAGADADDFSLQFAIKWVLVNAARSFLATDPAAALRTIDDVKIPSGLEYGQLRFSAAEVLVEIAKGLAVWDPERAKGVLNRAQLELRAISSRGGSAHRKVWSDLAEVLVQVDPALCGRLAAQLDDFAQDELLSALTTVDPPAAERVARSVTDPSRREKALATVAIRTCESYTP